MAYSIALQAPEAPLKEEWAWLTDTQTSYSGDEDRTPLNRYPKRSFSGTYAFDRVEAVRRQMALMLRRFGGTFRFPLFQYQVKLKTAAAALDTAVSVNATRGDFRAGRLALIIEGDVHEELEVDTVEADTLTFTTALVNDYSVRAVVCPVTEVFAATGAGFTRVNPDGSASASFRYAEKAPWTEFVDPLNESELTMFGGFAVLDLPSVGQQFDHSLETGIIISDYIGLPDVFSPWDQAQWNFPLRWQVNRIFDLEAWLWWFAFADHVQGSATTFLIPTHREDLEVVTPAALGGTGITVAGDEYTQHYWALDTFKRIVIDTDAGRHYATVTGISSVSGNDRLTFTPALPGGAGWNVNQSVEFLLKARIADDKITCDHYGLHTDVSINVRTVE